MSKVTRIKRPTTSTPRNIGTRRYVHVSAPLVEEIGKNGALTGRRVVGTGTTYRKDKP